MPLGEIMAIDTGTGRGPTKDDVTHCEVLGDDHQEFFFRPELLHAPLDAGGLRKRRPRVICRSIPRLMACDRSSETNETTLLLHSGLSRVTDDRQKGCLAMEKDC